MLSDSSTPTLYMGAEDFVYIRECVSKAYAREVGGLGIIVVEDGKPVVRHMRLLKQKISAGEVEWAEDAHSEYLIWLYTSEEDGGAGFDGESYGVYSWHSHGNMGVFYSGTDDDFIHRVGATVPYIFSTVFNNKGEFKNRLDVWSTFDCDIINDGKRRQITWGHDSVRLEILPYIDAAPIADEGLQIEIAAETEITALKKELNGKIKAIETERDEKLKPLRTAITEINKRLHGDVKADVEDDFRAYVTNFYGGGTGMGFHRPTQNGSKPQTGGASDPKSLPAGEKGSQSQPASTSTTSPGKKADKGKVSSGTETKGSEDIGDGDIRDLVQLRAYDTTAKRSSYFTIRQIIEDDDLVLMDDVHRELLARLNDTENKILEDRQSYDEYFDEKIRIGREMHQRGPYS